MDSTSSHNEYAEQDKELKEPTITETLFLQILQGFGFLSFREQTPLVYRYSLVVVVDDDASKKGKSSTTILNYNHVPL
jgi:hypothetical protein